MPELTGPQLIHASIGFQNELTAQRPLITNTIIRSMRRHPTIKLARFLSIAPALASNWSVDVMNKDKELPVEDIKALVREQIFPSRQWLLEKALLGMIDFGWAGFEVVWNGFDIKKFKPLLNDITTILADAKTGDFIGFRQKQTVQGFTDARVHPEIDIVFHQALRFSQYVEGTDWYGNSDMQDAHSDWVSSTTTDATARRYDTKTAGAHWHIDFPVGESPYGSAGDITDHGVIAADMISKLQANGSIATPNGADRMLHDMDVAGALRDNNAWKITLIESSGKTSSSLNERSKYLDVRLVRAFLQPERAMLEGEHGTKAESGDHQDLAFTMVEHRHQSVLAGLNQSILGPVKMLVTAHFGPEAGEATRIIAEPIEEGKKTFLRELYTKILSTPDGQLLELTNIDLDQLRELTDVPTLEGETEDTIILDAIKSISAPEEVEEA